MTSICSLEKSRIEKLLKALLLATEDKVGSLTTLGYPKVPCGRGSIYPDRPLFANQPPTAKIISPSFLRSHCTSLADDAPEAGLCWDPEQ